MKRILYLNKDGILGGSAISLLLLIKHLKKSYDIFVIFGRDGEFRKVVEKLHIPVKVINFYGWRQIKNIFRNLYSILKLKIFLKQNKFDIIHSNSYEINPLMVLAAPKDVTTICHIRDLISYEKARKYLVNRAKVIISISKAVANNLTPLENLKVIYNGVDFSEASKSKPFLPIKKIKNKGKILVGIIGNCEERKRQEDFIKAGIEILKKCKNFYFFIIGNSKTEYGEKLKQLVKDYEQFFYFIPFQKNIFSILKSLDIIVIASKEEAFGRVAIESAACKKPVIATKIGGLKEIIIHRKTGLLFPPYNYKKLAEYILLLGKDAVLRKKLGNAGYNYVKQKFTHTQYINKIMNIYELY